MNDLISRQAAIDALDRIFDRCEEIEAHLPEGDPDRTGYKMYPDYMTVWKYLHQLPSAQTEERTETHACDCISRQAAVDVLEKIPVREFKKSDDGLLDALVSIGQVYNALKKLPSAQTEPQWIPCSEKLPEEYGEYRITWTTSA